MKTIVLVESMLAIALVSVGVALQWGYPFGLISAGALLEFEVVTASIAALITSRGPSK